jgi:transposase
MAGKSGKNDAADAQAICEAVRRPHMRFVPVKDESQQAMQCLHVSDRVLSKRKQQHITD